MKNETSPIHAAEELLDVVKKISDISDIGIEQERLGNDIIPLVKRKIELMTILENQMRDANPTRDSFPEYGDAQGDLMDFIYKRFEGMPIAAIVGFLEMAKLAIMDEA